MTITTLNYLSSNCCSCPHPLPHPCHHPCLLPYYPPTPLLLISFRRNVFTRINWIGPPTLHPPPSYFGRIVFSLWLPFVCFEQTNLKKQRMGLHMDLLITYDWHIYSLIRVKLRLINSLIIHNMVIIMYKIYYINIYDKLDYGVFLDCLLTDTRY